MDDPLAVVVFSGGMDSTVLAYYVKSLGYKLHLVSFNYGQKHRKELNAAKRTAEKLKARHDIIDLTGITKQLGQSGSSLVSDQEVPEGSYDAENMKSTVVPNRNMVMISVASAVAVAEEADSVFIGVHAGDHTIYPDCRPRFLKAVNAAVVIGNAGFGVLPDIKEVEKPVEYVRAPFIYSTKGQIAYTGLELEVPFIDTWSCYKGGDRHCGRCGTCVERLEAIDWATREFNSDNGLDKNTKWDFTRYEDTEYWKEALTNAHS
jgi:7-cyano-7-deazaguanine synthase